MKITKYILIILFAGMTSCKFEESKTDKTNDYFLFSYFIKDSKDQINKGLRYAISLDGIQWNAVNNSQAIFIPEFGSVFRDPCIVQGKDGVFHIVWTVDWTCEDSKKSIGMAHSKDLIHWYDAKEIEVMQNPDVANCWAPELLWDEESDRWMLYWASSIRGKFPETLVKCKNEHTNNRMYYLWLSEDFEVLSEAKLLYGPDFIVNDVHIFQTNMKEGKYCMIVKKILQPGKLAPLFIAFSDYIDSGYELIEGEAISGKYQFLEGPSVISIQDSIYCYFDLSREERIGCIRNDEIKSGAWEDLTDELDFPSNAKHGTIIRIDEKNYNKLLSFSIQ